ncbi:transporter substrate-binding domain-containing protein [Nostoc sp. FACHB-152]|uniref:transporter substrate-binding domain-containing protein n=1 Tax=unclassified Nostoc TaxID=2593658 RepID=UPI00168756AA|nr:MULTISPECIES: transporter substrate-binding domain-containing protein [unclassified Nostoc]MBD2446065.1 transporter substrate-binding domain-containing protein [Nostoc sp. FACHB-152]MBD2467297.1 transporter substrate-binding domain-containing protein [Nostoc sp. FACHB-145]
MKAETYLEHKSRGLKGMSLLLKKLVTQQIFFSSFILYPLSFIRLHLVLPATIYTFCFLTLVTGLPASAAEMPKIQRRGYFNIAIKDNLRPLGFRDANGNLQGLEIDLAQRLAVDLLGKADAVKLQPVANRDRLSVVLNHQVDFAIARVTATESRARLVSFSVPYYYDGTYLITKDTSIQQLRDLEKRKVVVLNHSNTIAQVRYYLPNAELVGVNSYQEAREQLENNKVIAFAADASVLSGWVQQYPQYRLLPTKLSTEPLSVVLPKGLQYDELRRNVNEAIARYIAEGWLKQRAQYWRLP